jgi:hypothetical protein
MKMTRSVRWYGAIWCALVLALNMGCENMMVKSLLAPSMNVQGSVGFDIPEGLYPKSLRINIYEDAAYERALGSVSVETEAVSADKVSEELLAYRRGPVNWMISLPAAYRDQEVYLVAEADIWDGPELRYFIQEQGPRPVPSAGLYIFDLGGPEYPQYDVSAGVSPTERGSVTPSRTRAYASEVVTLTIRPENGYRVIDIQGRGTGGESPGSPLTFRALNDENTGWNFVMPPRNSDITAAIILDRRADLNGIVIRELSSRGETEDEPAFLLDPVFDPDTTLYRTWVDNRVEDIRVSMSLAEEGAVVSFQMDLGEWNTTGGFDHLTVGEHSLIVKVESGDGKRVKTYTVLITRSAKADKDIVVLMINGSPGTVNSLTNSVNVIVPAGTASLAAPVIFHTGQSISPESETLQDFRDPVLYTVTAANGESRTYEVTMTPRDAKRMAYYGIVAGDEVYEGIIDEEAKTITVMVPYGTGLKNLSPTLRISGAAVSPGSEEALDFDGDDPVEYVVTSVNGDTETYQVRVIEERNSENQITAFNISLGGSLYRGTFDHNAIPRAVLVRVPTGTNMTALRPEITVSPGASVSPRSGEANNFTQPQNYVVTAEDGTSVSYRVTVEEQESTAKFITGFSIIQGDNAYPGSINATAQTVTVNVPYGSVLTAMTPSIDYEGVQIEPAADEPQDFSEGCEYTIKAADGSSAVWIINVTPAMLQSITVTKMPDKTVYKIGEALDPSGIVIQGRDSRRNDIDISPGDCEFSEILRDTRGKETITVSVKETSVLQTFQVSVVSTEAEISGFSFSGITGSTTTINHEAGTVLVRVPQGTNMAALRPVITVSPGAELSPGTGEEQNFTGPQDYEVRAEDGETTAVYTVRVEEISGTAKYIEEFKLNIGGTEYSGTVNDVARTVNIYVPYGSNLTALVPQVTWSGESIDPPIDGTARDFSSGLFYYTIEATDGSLADWEISVNSAALQNITIDTLPTKTRYAIGEALNTAGMIIQGRDVRGNTINIPVEDCEFTGISRVSPGTETITVTVKGTSIFRTFTITVMDDSAVITDLIFNGIATETEINQTGKTISAAVPRATSLGLNTLTPVFTCSAGAGVALKPGETANFAGSVVYRVTAEDGVHYADYTLTVRLKGEGQIGLGLEEVIAIDITPSNAINNNVITIHKSLVRGPDSLTLTVQPNGYTNYAWYVNGNLTVTANNVCILNAAAYPLGKNSVSVEVRLSGAYYSRELFFMVEP